MIGRAVGGLAGGLIGGVVAGARAALRTRDGCCPACGRTLEAPRDVVEVDVGLLRGLLRDVAVAVRLPVGYFDAACTDELEMLERAVTAALTVREGEFAAMRAWEGAR